MSIDPCNDLAEAGVGQEVESLRKNYHRARRRYRKYTARSPPRLAALQRLAATVYVRQGRHYDQHSRLLYPNGVLPRVTGLLRRRTPELRDDSFSPAQRNVLDNSITEMVSYASYRGLLQLPEVSIKEMFRYKDLHAAPLEEFNVMSLVEHVRDL